MNRGSRTPMTEALKQQVAAPGFATGERVRISSTCEAGLVTEAHHFMAKPSWYRVKIEGHPHKFVEADEGQIAGGHGIQGADQ